MKRTIRIITKSKYIIAIGVFAVLMLFVDHNDLFVQMDRQRELNELLESRSFYEAAIAQTRHNLNNLQNNPAAIEKFAREKYNMKKTNEDVFIILPPETDKNKAVKQ